MIDIVIFIRWDPSKQYKSLNKQYTPKNVSVMMKNKTLTLSLSRSHILGLAHTHIHFNTQTQPGAWHVSLSPVFGQLSCDTPSMSALDYYQSSSARLGSVVQSHVRALCWVLSYTGSMLRGSCNTCGSKWPSGFSGPRAHGWQVYHIPRTDRTSDCLTIPNRGKQ